VKAEPNRQRSVVTTMEHDANPLPTSLLDAAIELTAQRHTAPLLHEAIEATMERQSVELEFVEEVLVKPKPKPRYWGCDLCDRTGRSVCRPVLKVRE
jgi:hypothetical protein